MTDEDAKREAERRWGRIAVVRDRQAHYPLVPRFMVGVLAHAEHNCVTVHGEGATWEEAFADADERAEFLKPYMNNLRTLS